MKFALNSQQQNYQILTNDVQMLILRLSYFIATVMIANMIKILLSQLHNCGQLKLDNPITLSWTFFQFRMSKSFQRLKKPS